MLWHPWLSCYEKALFCVISKYPATVVNNVVYNNALFSRCGKTQSHPEFFLYEYIKALSYISICTCMCMCTPPMTLTSTKTHYTTHNSLRTNGSTDLVSSDQEFNIFWPRWVLSLYFTKMAVSKGEDVRFCHQMTGARRMMVNSIDHELVLELYFVDLWRQFDLTTKTRLAIEMLPSNSPQGKVLLWCDACWLTVTS